MEAVANLSNIAQGNVKNSKKTLQELHTNFWGAEPGLQGDGDEDLSPDMLLLGKKTLKRSRNSSDRPTEVTDGNVGHGNQRQV